MKNIPIFTTENGAASLILREIPYTKRAYVHIQASQNPIELAEECAQFCICAGAEEVYACGDPMLENYPVYTATVQMHVRRESLEKTDAALIPVTEATLTQWRELYNIRMKAVPNSAWMTVEDAREMLQKEDGYFVYRGSELLGIGRASEDRIDLVASAVPGGGKPTLLALARAATAETLRLTVASANTRAVRFYEKLGFEKVKEITKWYILRDCQGKTLDKEESL